MLTSALRYLAYSTTLVMFSLTLTACGSSSSGDDGAFEAPDTEHKE